MLLQQLICLTICLIGWVTADGYNPEQVHLSLSGNGFDIVVTWSTLKATNESIVKYGITADNLEFSTDGTSHIFVNGEDAKQSQEIHRVNLTNLQPNTRYYYSCGGSLAYSKVFHFKTFPNNSNWSPRFAILGDLGLQDGLSIDPLIEDVKNDLYDVIIHNGDIAYNLHERGGKQGDDWMKKMEPMAAYVPYMVGPGNHEYYYNFSDYINRFNMPGDHDNLYYSVNIGPVHVIIFSSEFYYSEDGVTYYTMNHTKWQYEWLTNDLEKANKNRDKQPWIITLGHRPMYCTNTRKYNDECTYVENELRVGVGVNHTYPLEKLFYDYGVDIIFAAHQHTYERFYPMYNFTMYKGSEEQPYVNPKAPVHIISGSAGCREKGDEFVIPAPPYSVSRSNDYGYTRLNAYNKTHLYFSSISVKDMPLNGNDVTTELIDNFWLIKDSQGPYKQ